MAMPSDANRMYQASRIGTSLDKQRCDTLPQVLSDQIVRRVGHIDRRIKTAQPGLSQKTFVSRDAGSSGRWGIAAWADPSDELAFPLCVRQQEIAAWPKNFS